MVVSRVVVALASVGVTRGILFISLLRLRERLGYGGFDKGFSADDCQFFLSMSSLSSLGRSEFIDGFAVG
jgi:hypothetical protein